jgi:hypothetical protein
MKTENSLTRFWFIPLILLVGLLAGLTWVNHRFAEENPGGNDFLVHWVGTRALLIEGLSPYSDEIALRIQTLAYGRAARPGEHELRVAYPLYAEIFFAPFALIGDYPWARALWMTALEAALVGLALLSLRLTDWRPGVWFLPFFVLFALLWYHGLRPLINGNAVILVALLIAAVLASLQAGRDELAGILLAFATIKPQVALLPIVFVFWWVLTARRGRVIFWTFATLVLLTVVSMFFLPDWPLQNLREVLRYPTYNPPGTPGAALAFWLPASGQKLGWGLTAILILLLLAEWLATRRKEFRHLLWTASLTLMASQWIGIQTDPGNFVTLFLPLTLIWAVWMERWGRRGWAGVAASMLILFVGLWALFLKTVDSSGGQPQQHPIMFFPLPLFVLIGLYWVRWWAIRPARLLIEKLREREE